MEVRLFPVCVGGGGRKCSPPAGYLERGRACVCVNLPPSSVTPIIVGEKCVCVCGGEGEGGACMPKSALSLCLSRMQNAADHVVWYIGLGRKWCEVGQVQAS